ncbi:hypothetical protein EDD18DRAFT_1124265 [Armillaria luteobubalina]|uniref:Uncharacterized protein n=1 Tax=Armillaria luteobubalina TaxID=153913 RepID=A0AA39QRN1_9AGAR|nr:hypothetical protein EDD18DRAFT_1124265 [Armillaria luteobubalina]
MRNIIDSLDDEVWLLIIENISPFPSLHRLPYDIASLAGVSRHLRHLCFSVAFKKVSWKWANPCTRIKPFSPPSLGRYIRELEFVIVQLRPITPPRHGSIYQLHHLSDHMEFISEMVNTAAPSLCDLHTVKIIFEDTNFPYQELLMGPWHTLLESIFLLPALESLELEAPWFAEDKTFPSLTLRHNNLRRLVYCAPFSLDPEAICTPEYGKRTMEQLAVETHNLRLLLDANRDSLEILELPGELADGVLDSSFPSLKELSLFGHGSDCHTWVSALPTQSHLRKLHIEIASNYSPPPIPIALHMTCSQLAELRSLTVSNPCPDDPLFRMLPPNLEHLSLVPYPDPFMIWWIPESEVPVKIVPCSAMNTIITTGSFESLTNLNVAYQWESDLAEISLLKLIVQTSPYLEFFELNRYGKKDSPFDIVSSLETSLRHLKYLSHLRLNLEKCEGKREVLFRTRTRKNMSNTMKEAIEQLSLSISSLRFISYLDLIFPSILSLPVWMWHKWAIERRNGNVELKCSIDDVFY